MIKYYCAFSRSKYWYKHFHHSPFERVNLSVSTTNSETATLLSNVIKQAIIFRCILSIRTQHNVI